MYDELVKAIRQNTCHFDACGMCPKRNELCLDRIALQAADAIEELSKPRWIPVTERKAEFPCICCDANGNLPFIPQGIVTIEDDQGVWQIDAHWTEPFLHQGKLKPVLGRGNRITHWMPLPEPPEEDET